jgi:hypothetical protein
MVYGEVSMMRTCDRPSRRGRPWRYSFLAALLVGVGGCGTPRCDVSGKVTYQGKAVVCGTITFVGSDGMPIVVPIQSDGAYQAKQVPVGPVQVAVLSLDPARPLNPFLATGRPDKQAGGAADAEADSRFSPSVRNPPADRSNWTDPQVDRSRWFPLPKSYELVPTSGLTAELHRGENTVNFDLQ